MRDAAGWVVGVTAGAAIALGFIALGGAGGESVPPGAAPNPAVVPSSSGGAERPARPETTGLPAPQPANASSATPPAAASSFDARLGIALYGTVVDSEHEPLVIGEDGVRLLLTSTQGDSRSVPIDEEGHYAVSGLPPGGLRLRLMPPAFLPVERTLDLVERDPVVRMDIVLQRTVQLVVNGVTRDGQPLATRLHDELPPSYVAVPLWVMATAEPPGVTVPALAERAFRIQPGLGRYVAGGHDTPEMLGRLELAAPLPLSVSVALGDVVLQTRRVDRGAEAVTFVLDVADVRAHLATVRLRVIDAATRQPLLDATASLRDQRTYGGGAKPGADGIYLWTDQPPGEQVIEMKCPGHQSWGALVQVPAGGTVDFGDVALDAPASISGVVQDAGGVRHKVSFDLRPLDTSREAGTRVSRWGYPADANGVFHIENLGHRDYELSVNRNPGETWTAPPLRVSTRGGDMENVIVVVTQGSLVRLVADWSARAGHDVEVRAADGGLALPGRTLWGGDVHTCCLLPGQYTASLRDDGADVRTVRFEVGPDAQTVVLAP